MFRAFSEHVPSMFRTCSEHFQRMFSYISVLKSTFLKINIWSRDDVNSVPWLDCFTFVQNWDDKISEKLYFAQLWRREGNISRLGGFFVTLILKKKTMLAVLWVLRIIEIHPHAIGNYHVRKNAIAFLYEKILNPVGTTWNCFRWISVDFNNRPNNRSKRYSHNVYIYIDYTCSCLSSAKQFQ